MKILHVISSLEVGGAQRLLSDLLPLVAKENLVSLLVFKNTDTIFEQYIKEKGIIINSLNVNCIYNPWIFVRLFLRDSAKYYERWVLCPYLIELFQS